MKHSIAIFCTLFFVVSFLSGCAGSATQIRDRSVKAEVAGGTTVAGSTGQPVAGASISAKKAESEGRGQAAGTAEAPMEKASVSLQGGRAEGGVTSPSTTEKPADKAYVDSKGRFEISPTPFGYVRRETKTAGKESNASGAGQPEPAVPLTPIVKAPAAPPVSGTSPAGPAPGSPDQLTDSKPSQNGGQVSFDFDDADLYAVIRTMADMLKINYIIEPGVSGKVTIHTAGRLKEEDLFPVFHQTLEVNGLAAVKEGNVYRILKLKDAQRMPISSRLARDAKDIPIDERVIIQIIPLKFISAQEVTKVITPFISTDGTIISEGGSNTLLLVDKGINVYKVLKLVEVFDVSVFEKIHYRFYALENIGAEETVKLLREVLSLVTGGKDDVQFIPISRLNTLLIVSASADIFSKVSAFIRQLDVPSDAAQPQIYIYSVKNGMASELGDTLQMIFAKGGEVRKAASKETVPTNPFAKGYTDQKTTGTTAATGVPTASATPAPQTASATTRGGPSVSLRGDVRITVDPIRNALIIEAIPGDFQIIEKILARLDVLPRQVLIEVVIAEISLGKGTELGIEWTFKKDSWTDSGPVSATIGATGLQYAVGLSQKWQVALHALARDSKVNILSSPSVLASDNKLAHIDVTTEVPIPSTSYQIQTTGPTVLETKVEYRNTGVILDVTPHINEHGLVTMDISQEVSNVGELLKVAGQDYYSFNKRKVATSLTVKHNQSIVIGGLISNTKNDAASGVPWLVKIPLLRWLFGTETTNVSKSELILMITPRVITNLDDVDAVSEEFKKKIGNAITFFR
jgi:general secretion pathway protein D